MYPGARRCPVWAVILCAGAQALAASTPEPRPTLCVEVVVTPGPAWKRHVIDNTSRGADGVKTGDLNGDGRTDFVTGWEEGGVVRVYLHPGRSRVREPWPRVTVGIVRDAEDAIFADLDRDGRPEVVSCTEGKTRTVYWHRFSGNPGDLLNPEAWSTVAFPAALPAQAWMQAVAVDLDGQHGLDLVLGSKNAGATIGWLQAPADPHVLGDWMFHGLREAGWIMSLVASDLDGDRDSDLLCSDRKGGRSGVFWLENPGATANRQHASWSEHALGALGREVMFLDVSDLNGDGRLDVAAAVKPRDVLLWLRQPDNGWREQTLPLVADNLGDAKAVKIADLNSDGLADMLFTCENAKGAREGIVWLEQGAAGGPWKQRSLGGPEGLKYDLMQVLDLDGDGDLDVVTCEESDQLGVVWYENPRLLGRRDFRGALEPAGFAAGVGGQRERDHLDRQHFQDGSEPFGRGRKPERAIGGCLPDGSGASTGADDVRAQPLVQGRGAGIAEEHADERFPAEHFERAMAERGAAHPFGVEVGRFLDDQTANPRGGQRRAASHQE